jgi:hypothetical protein
VGKVPKHSCRCDMFNIKDVIEWVEWSNNEIIYNYILIY